MDDAAPKAVRLSAAWQAYKTLQGEILRMVLLPGTPLQDRQLSARLEISRTPVREALLRLADEGLVDIFPQSGTYVSKIKAEEIPEVLEIRLVLEAITVTKAAARTAPADLAALEAVLARQAAFAARHDLLGFHEMDEEFHALIAATAGRPLVWKLVRLGKVQLDRIRMLTLPEPDRMAEVIAEHRSILEAIAAGRPAAARSAMKRHLSRLSPDVVRLRRQYPDYFA